MRPSRGQWGTERLIWWPAGAPVGTILDYAVIGTRVGTSEANGIGQREPGTLEALLTAAPGPIRLIPTRRGQGLPAAEVAAIPTRTGSIRNQTYFPLTPQSLTDSTGWPSWTPRATSAESRLC
ncbi:MAG: hypothetical protein ACOYEW_07980 [Anaerolineae bacterium]